MNLRVCFRSPGYQLHSLSSLSAKQIRCASNLVVQSSSLSSSPRLSYFKTPPIFRHLAYLRAIATSYFWPFAYFVLPITSPFIPPFSINLLWSRFPPSCFLFRFRRSGPVRSALSNTHPNSFSSKCSFPPPFVSLDPALEFSSFGSGLL